MYNRKLIWGDNMNVQVKLADIVDGLESASEENIALLNRTTGEVVYLLHHFLSDAEDEKPYDELPDWQQEQMVLANDVLNHEANYASLPSQFDINEYEMMKEFSYMQSDKVQNQLLQEIRGKGAFRRFKDKIYELNMEDRWYGYRDKSYEKIAIAFCQRYKMKYV